MKLPRRVEAVGGLAGGKNKSSESRYKRRRKCCASKAGAQAASEMAATYRMKDLNDVKSFCHSSSKLPSVAFSNPILNVDEDRCSVIGFRFDRAGNVFRRCELSIGRRSDTTGGA